MATVVAFAGEWDVASQKSFRREVRRLYDESALVLDFSEVTYIDSSCLADLIVMERKRNESGYSRATMIVKHAAVRKVLEVSGLWRIFRLASSLEDLQAEFNERFVVEYAQRSEA